MDDAHAEVVPELFSSQFLRNPYPTYRQCLEGPTVQPLANSQRWGVFRYASCTTLLRDPRLSNALPARWLVSVPEESLREFDDLVHHMQRWMLTLDAPDHTRLRKMMNKGFAPLSVAKMRPRVEAIVTRLMDRIESRSDPDLVRDLAYPLPVIVICELLGIPTSLHDRCTALTNDVAMWFADYRRSAEAARRAQRAIRELTGYFEEIIRERKRVAGDDLLSLLLNIADDESRKMRPDELYAQCVMLLVAGHETTRHLISNAIHTLLDHPAALAAVREQVELVGPAVEEVLRFEPPVQMIGKVLTAEMDIDGVVLPTGSSLVLILAAAHRDSRQFEQPDRFDVHRRHIRHLAFGGDAHVCLGTTLARLEGQIALSTLVQRFPHLERLEAEADWDYSVSPHLRGLHSLRVKY